MNVSTKMLHVLELLDSHSGMISRSKLIRQLAKEENSTPESYSATGVIAGEDFISRNDPFYCTGVIYAAHELGLVEVNGYVDIDKAEVYISLTPKGIDYLIKHDRPCPVCGFTEKRGQGTNDQR